MEIYQKDSGQYFIFNSNTEKWPLSADEMVLNVTTSIFQMTLYTDSKKNKQYSNPILKILKNFENTAWS